MKVVELRQEADLQRLRSDWDRLVCRSASRTIFLTWEWMAAWWSAYGNPDGLRILAVYDDAGELRGIAPLRHEKIQKYGQTVSTLSFVGDGSNDSDYLDFIVERGYEKPVMEAFYTHCAKSLDSGTVLLLNEMPATSVNMAILKDLAESQAIHWAAASVPCATVRLPATWEDYLQMLQPRFRTKIRSVLRNLENRPEIRFGFCDNVGQVKHLLPVLFDLHSRRWAREGKPGVFGRDAKREFYDRLSTLLMERHWLRFSYLEWKGRVLACQYGFAYHTAYSQLQEGYEPASEHWNPGVALRAWSIREFLKEGLTEYDFLGGVSRHKTDWGAETKYSQRIVIARERPNNVLFLRGPQWSLAGREAIRKLVPERVLSGRHRVIEGRLLHVDGRRIREAAAGCYLHSGMPSVTRWLRQRYQLSIGCNGAGRKLSWMKRREGSARILYYHRVTDESNVLFGGISPRAFEQQMRYLARYHKVASISEIVRHLDEGESTETLVGITFDDGYRDNYENAFPILQRYGLPATIFLTTGSIDSGEPLWFERLAEAVQKTTRDYMDLEIDVPRRFWMRTVSERVASSRQIFLLLRSMENGERNQRLSEILKLLGGERGSERRNKMLTWEQARLMQTQRIDFGGHTVSHPFLSKLTASEAAWEISESKRRIEEELQNPVHHFAYPNGREEDFREGDAELIRTAGYQAAMTTIWGMNYRSTDRMQLKRGGPWEANGALFGCKLDWYQLTNQ
jgi:peptidoglycan/xylan/chitin deacetylase (PgdA/CDA1 family)/CelD/BcsL family acetyltransferase involved in cellulose biosynthesis